MGKGTKNRLPGSQRGLGRPDLVLRLVGPGASLASLWQLILETRIIFDIRARGGSWNFREFLSVSSLPPTHATDLRRNSHQPSLVLDPLGTAWMGQGTDISSGEHMPEHSPYFLLPTALVPLVSPRPRAGQAAGSAGPPGKSEALGLFPEWPENSVF